MMKTFLLFILALLPLSAGASISLGVSAVSSSPNPVQQAITLAITTDASAQRMMVVNASNSNVTTYNTVSSITANGTSLTRTVSGQNHGGTIYIQNELWVYPNPTASTAYTVVVTFGAVGQQNSASVYQLAGTNPILLGASTSSGGTTQTFATHLTTLYANSWVICSAAWYASNAAITKDAALTQRSMTNFTPVGHAEFLGDRTTTSAGNYSVTNTVSLAITSYDQLLLEIVELQPTPTPSITPSATPSITPTSTITPSITQTSTITPSVTPTSSATPSVTPTSSATPTATPTETSTPVPNPCKNVYVSFDGCSEKIITPSWWLFQ